VPLQRLAVNSLRNLNAVDIHLSNRINLFYGQNGSGKTSVLEAVSVLGLGRSFRSHKLKPLISTEDDHFTVFGAVHESDLLRKVGVMRSRSGDSLFKLDGEPVSTASALAECLPVQVINAQTFQLLEGSPKQRRQFIDWLVFHVEPEFLSAWKGLQRCLKHRNSLLRRDRIAAAELAPWDLELCLLAEKIDSLRESRIQQFLSVFETLVAEFIALDDLKLSYQRGWDRDTPLQEVLAETIERDSRQGFTYAGPHRADLRIMVGKQLAADVLSRGQQKLLVCALRIAQGYVFSQQTQRSCLFLIDDLPAELDSDFQSIMARWLLKMDCQVLITGVDRDTLESVWAEHPTVDRKVFHVEHGRVVVADGENT